MKHNPPLQNMNKVYKIVLIYYSIWSETGDLAYKLRGQSRKLFSDKRVYDRKSFCNYSYHHLASFNRKQI